MQKSQNRSVPEAVYHPCVKAYIFIPRLKFLWDDSLRIQCEVYPSSVARKEMCTFRMSAALIQWIFGTVFRRKKLPKEDVHFQRKVTADCEITVYKRMSNQRAIKQLLAA